LYVGTNVLALRGQSRDEERTMNSVYASILAENGLSNLPIATGIEVRTPVDGSVLAHVQTASSSEVEQAIDAAHTAFLTWRTIPAPRRGELVRLFGDVLRANKAALGRLVSLESGKILAEGLGEVQEMIDICDFATGLSRQLYGLTIASERPGHRMMETWHPLGVTAVISAFNFPVAVWAWNAALALVCGNPVIWKPSEKTPLTALASAKLLDKAITTFSASASERAALRALSTVLIGDRTLGEALAANPKIALVSATGSTRMGREVAPVVAKRFGRVLLELGGNNAMIVTPTADLDLAVRAIVFSAIGTCGQRCTSLRRLIVHESVHAPLLEKVRAAYASAQIGSPLDTATLVGPLIDQSALEAMQQALTDARAQGGVVFGGERSLAQKGGAYVSPAIVDMPAQTDVVKRETFAPILYAMRYSTLDQAIAMQNDVPQGLSSCIFSNDVRECELFLSAAGSDCGIANVNIGPSGAEIGGAFGGEKETGGGRESGSDAWRAYMRRATNTVNYSRELPLAQGISFG
jgi:aldehyde dehydrogenase (NAD+)